MPAKKKTQGTALDMMRGYMNRIHKTDDSENWGEVHLDASSRTSSMPHVPTGSLVVDYAIGGEPNASGVAPCPGFPRGRVTQIWGHEGSGKTTLALQSAAAVIANGGTVLFVDYENDIALDYAASLGVPIEDQAHFMLTQPETMELGLQSIKVAVMTGVDMVIIDSVGAGVPKQWMEQDLKEIADGKATQPGVIARLWSQHLPALKTLAKKSNTALIGLSQTRSTMNSMAFAKQSQPQGGYSWRFYSAVRLELQRIKTEKTQMVSHLTHRKEQRVWGAQIRVKVVKCKLSTSQGRECTLYIRWGQGIDDLRTLIEVGNSHNIIRRKGAWYEWNPPGKDQVRGQGMDNFRLAVKKDESLVDALYDQVIPLLTRESDDQHDEDLEKDLEEALGEGKGIDLTELEKMVEEEEEKEEEEKSKKGKKS